MVQIQLTVDVLMKLIKHNGDEDMVLGIYCYVDKKDNSIVYIGKDSNIDKNVRRYAHRKPSQYNKQPFNRILQNNPERYEYKVLVKGVSDYHSLNQLEIFYIAMYNPKFNFTIGGESNVRLKGRDNPWFGRKHDKDTLRKISSIKNKTGFMNVSKNKSSNCRQGFYYEYTYTTTDNKRKSFSSTDILKLKEKVLSHGLDWEILDKKKADETMRNNLSLRSTNTGFYKVTKTPHKTSKTGHHFRYVWMEKGCSHQISSVNLATLRDRVVDAGLKWKIIDEELATRTVQEEVYPLRFIKLNSNN